MTTSPAQQHDQMPESRELAIPPNQTKRPIWEIVAEIGAQIPDEEWAKVPSDASINYKHYLYGAPRKDA